MAIGNELPMIGPASGGFWTACLRLPQLLEPRLLRGQVPLGALRVRPVLGAQSPRAGRGRAALQELRLGGHLVQRRLLERRVRVQVVEARLLLWRQWGRQAGRSVRRSDGRQNRWE